MLTPFTFQPGDIVRMQTPLMTRAGKVVVQPNERGEIVYLTYDHNGTSASVKFPHYRCQVREDQLTLAG